MSAAVQYRRAAHAAHSGSRPLWDLEQWDVAQERDALRPASVPSNAERHHGYVDCGVQHVVYTRTAPVTECPDCAICKTNGVARQSATWVVVYALGRERHEATASCKEDALASVHAYRRAGWTAWAELRSRWAP